MTADIQREILDVLRQIGVLLDDLRDRVEQIEPEPPSDN